ncbi:LysR family transcriptional regulator [Sphingobium sp. Leaf26]|uniref:LysR family transcriptional regulator n=1 Tax=Sphingobium sp. Leaf26 TaxID=1735693 RepID=UPI0007018A83|nr:LysR family transcriptional regulator [Sphingobium sp. Leaf26]KQN06646.1 LysR family transcriptional regulator [Sphingobium sp. Leaf26]
MNSPSLRQLDIFAQMVAAGSVTRCAADLDLSIEQVLQDLASLEMRLGYRLFDDLDGATRLTPAGRKTAQAMTLLSQDAPAPTEAPMEEVLPPETEPDIPPVPAIIPVATPSLIVLEGPPRKVITLAAPAPVFGQLQDGLSAFEAANEDIAITLDLHVHTAEDAASTLANGRADIAYFYALEEPTDFGSRYGWSEQLNLYAGSDHALARADSVSRDDLALTPMLALETRSGLRDIIDAALAKGRFHNMMPMLESDNMFEIIAALREGAGCFAAFGTLARDIGRMSGVQRLALDMPLPAIEIRQAVAPRSTEKPAVEALAQFLFL